MNLFIGLGRIVRDVNVQYTNGGKVYAKFTVAIDRPYRKDQPKETDFINCTAFGKTAETIGNCFHKGSRILVRGRLQIGSYTAKDGSKKYTADIIVSDFDFVDNKGTANSGGENAGGGFESMGAEQALPDSFQF